MTAPAAARLPHRLHRLEDAGSAAVADDPDVIFLSQPSWHGTELEARLRSILEQGECGCRRVRLGPLPCADARLQELGSRAPHLAALTEFVLRHLRACGNMGVPTSLPPIPLFGGPGTGRTWCLTRLGALLGVSFRTYPMNGLSLSEGLHGAHPDLRNAQPRLVTATLLQEEAANPIIFVDEADKAHGLNADPFRPFYDGLEPVGAAAFRDEYLQFPMDASGVMWVLAANAAEALPDAILDRLEAVHVPASGREALAAAAMSVYAEANGIRRTYSEPGPPAPSSRRSAWLGRAGASSGRGTSATFPAARSASQQGSVARVPEDKPAPRRSRSLFRPHRTL